MSTVMTIGYEGATLPDFLATLRASGVDMIIDVRQLPLSRRKGFSKTALAAALGESGVSYVHLPSLGDPKPGRDAAKAGRFDEFQRIFTAHLQTDAAVAGLERVAALMREATVCLLCYERDPIHCHRSLVVRALRDRLPVRVKHLGVQSGVAGVGTAGMRTRTDPGQGTSARQSDRGDRLLRGGY